MTRGVGAATEICTMTSERDRDQATEPGRTPGQAEGERGDQPATERDPGRTPGQAEGDRATVDEAIRQQEQRGDQSR